MNATLNAFPTSADKFSITDGLNRTLNMLPTPASQGKPLGWMAQSDWQQTIDLLHKFAGLATVKPVGDYYTNAYLPQS